MVRNNVKSFSLIIFLMIAMPVFGNAKPTNNVQDSLRLEELYTRLNEIKSMDMENLTPAERKELKKEVREIKKESKRLASGGIYLSIGAILIIILVLILIL